MNSLVLFSLHNGNSPYDDNWGGDGIMHYTGMGLSGDQAIDYMQNKTLAQSRTNSIDIHLFESYEPNQYIYRGQVELASDPYYARQKDENGPRAPSSKIPVTY